LSTHYGIRIKRLQAGVTPLFGDTVGHYILNIPRGQASYLFRTTGVKAV
jgi:hypothetical protein